MRACCGEPRWDEDARCLSGTPGRDAQKQSRSGGGGGPRRRHRPWLLRGDGDEVGVAEADADLHPDLASTSAANSQLWRAP